MITNIISLNEEKLSNFRCYDCNLIPEIKLIYNDKDDYNDKIQIFYKCENNHKGIVSINDFMIKSINFDIYNILCSNNEKHIQNDRISFIYCIQCDSFFCPECHKQHENIHNKFCKINEFDYQCKFHNKSYSKYCFNCSKNICDECLNEHLNHNVKNIDNNFNIEKYIDKINKANKYNDNVVVNINNYVRYIDGIVEQLNNKKKILLNNLECFKNLNKLEIELCNKLIIISKNSRNILNYNIINNLKSILNFNDFKIDNLKIDLTQENQNYDCNFIISHSNSFLTNLNNFILKNSYFNYSLDYIEKIKKNEKEKSFILSGIQLLDNRIAFSFSNSNINIYDYNLQNNLTIKLSEDEYGLCLFQLPNERLLVGTNFGNIYNIFIDKIDKIQGKYSLTNNERKLRIIKILNHPDKKKLIIVFEDAMIKIININNFNVDDTIIIKNDKINLITNSIINNNKLVFFSEKDKLITFWEYLNNNFNECKNTIKFSCVDWLEGVMIIDKERILAIGDIDNKNLILLININNYQIKQFYLKEQYFSFYNIGNNSFLIGGLQKFIQGFIEGDNIKVNEEKKYIIRDIKENDLIMKFIDMGNRKFVIGCQRGEIIKYQFNYK